MTAGVLGSRLAGPSAVETLEAIRRCLKRRFSNREVDDRSMVGWGHRVQVAIGSWTRCPAAGESAAPTRRTPQKVRPG